MKIKTVPILAGITLASVLGIGGVQLAAAQDTSTSTSSTTVQDGGSTTTAPDSSSDDSTTTAPDSSSGTEHAPSKENCPNMGGSSDSNSSSGATNSAYRTGMRTRAL